MVIGNITPHQVVAHTGSTSGEYDIYVPYISATNHSEQFSVALIQLKD